MTASARGQRAPPPALSARSRTHASRGEPHAHRVGREPVLLAPRNVPGLRARGTHDVQVYVYARTATGDLWR